MLLVRSKSDRRRPGYQRSSMFAPGDSVEFRTVEGHDGIVSCGHHAFGALTFGPTARTAVLTIGDRELSLRGYARGWHLAAFDPGREIAAWYAERWILPGRLSVGPVDARLLLPLAWRDWTLRADGKEALRLDRSADGVVGRLGTLPEGCDQALVVGFTVAVVQLRSRFRARPVQSGHVAEGRAESLDALFDTGLEGDVDYGAE